LSAKEADVKQKTMNRINSVSKLMITALVCGVVLVSCSGGSGGAKGLIGTWEAEVMGTPAAMTFKEDGSMKSLSFGEEYDLSYEVKENSFDNPETGKNMTIWEVTMGIKETDGSWKNTMGGFFYDGGDEFTAGGTTFKRKK